MAHRRTDDIRNLAFVGQAGAGKTTLIEALLVRAGAIAMPGSVERGTTVCDHTAQARAVGHSVESAIASFDFAGHPVTLIDTPGAPDFLGRALAVLPAVETACIVVSAQTGVTHMTHRYMYESRARGLDRVIVINKVDADGVDAQAVLQQVRAEFGAQCMPLNLPAGRGTSVVDCFFHPRGVATDFSSVEAAHAALVDQVVEVDDALMALYLEQGEELQPEQLHDPFEQALREGHLVPVCFTSARTGAGVDALLATIVRLMPNPHEGNPPVFLDGAGTEAQAIAPVCDPERHVLAHVFRIALDPFIGRVAACRVHQGTVRRDAALFVNDARKSFRVGQLFRLRGREHEAVECCVPGDICAIAKVDEIEFDAVLHDSHDEDHIRLRSIELPEPMHGLALVTRSRGDEQKLPDALARLVAEDPSARIEHHPALNETVLKAYGELHHRVLLEDLRTRFHVDVEARTPRIAYRETVAGEAEGHHRHKKQTGGAGQFGEVSLRVQPRPRGAGFEFVDAVVGGAIPRQFMPAVEKGVRQGLAQGAIAGYPVEDIRVTVFDGRAHAVDSKEVAFVVAARKALHDALRRAAPLILEPVVDIEVTLPADRVGPVAADLSTRRGRVTGSSSAEGGISVIRGQVPLAELAAYASELKSMTAGVGRYTLSRCHYEPAPGRVQQELMAQSRPLALEE